MLGKRAILDELIHFHSVPERLVGDQTGDRAVGDDIVHARLNGRGTRQMNRLVNQPVHKTRHGTHQIRDLIGVGALSRLHHPAVPADDRKKSIDPAVMLGQLPVL